MWYNVYGDKMLKDNLSVLKKIEDFGFSAYLVGGCVRDYCMKRESSDIDICTNAKPKDLVNIFEDAILPKEKYGAVTIYYKNVRYEITTFRKELKYENRRPVEIEYIDDLNLDLQRRDFTVNALAMDSNGNIIDLFNGIKDIKSKVIRSLGDANLKFKEDPLRILRAIRFATVLNFKMDTNILSSICDNAYLLKEISYDRKKVELVKIFSSSNAKYGIRLLKSLNVDKYLDFRLDKLRITSDVIGIWAQLDVCDVYPFSKIEKDMLNDIIKIVNNKSIGKYEIYKYGLYKTCIAAEILGINKKVIVNMDRKLPIRSRKDIDFSTYDAKKLLDIKEGKWIKDLFDDLEIKILNKKLKNKKDNIKEYILKNY